MDGNLIQLLAGVIALGVAVAVASTPADLALGDSGFGVSSVLAAGGLVLMLFSVRDLSPKNRPFYKHGQGVPMRIGAAILLAAGLVYSAISLYDALDFRPQEAYPTLYFFAESRAEFPGINAEISWRLFLSFALAGLGCYGIYVFSNHPRVSDFLIETEVEMKKVTWPTRKEVVGSSIVVIATVLVLGVYIYVVDIVFSQLRDVFRQVVG